MMETRIPRSTMARFLRYLLDRLNAEGVPYCVLRNYDGLPEKVGNDIDFLVAPEAIDRFQGVVLHTARESGWTLVKHENRYGYRSYYLSTSRFDGLLHLDVRCPYHWKGITFASDDAILRTRVRRKSFYIPSKGCEAAVSLVKDLLPYGRAKERYLERITRFSREDADNFCATLSGPFGKQLTSRLLGMVQAGDWNGVSGMQRPLRRSLLMRALSHRPWRQLINWARFLMGHLNECLFHPTGFFLVLMGPDGVGKSSVAAGLQEQFVKKLFPKVETVHFRPGMLPELKAVMRSLIRRGGKVHEGRQGTQQEQGTGTFSEKMIWLLRLCYYTLDFVLGHLTIGLARSRGKLVVYDRYYYEYMMQQSRSRLPIWLIRLLGRMVPRPDAVVSLHASPDCILQRKQELTFEEVAMQLERYEQIARELPCAYLVDANSDLNAVVNRVAGIVLKRMAERYRNVQ